ncbi:MAG: IS701 family transposase [Candidatus Tectomicrobia bacterium]|nr:IS701 family transposase [Candidatus Tectomicrobia bacterium]
MPQAPSEPPPELAEFLSHFHVHFAQQRSRATLARYLSGLLTEHPRKNCDTLAAIVQGTTEQQLQHLLTEMAWDEEDLNRQRVQVLRGVRTERDGVLLIDDTGFAKQGHHSVGVARQYSGTLGKVGNCQVTVNCHYAERTLAWPVATRLYLPRQWAEDAERRQAAHVPADLPFQTKAEIALTLVDRANAYGVRHACVVADADYGDNPAFLNGLETRRERYCVAVRADFRVTPTRTQGGRSQRADAALATWPARHWQAVTWRQGSAGPLRGKFLALRCWRVDGDGSRHMGWLIGQRPSRGQAGERKYYWSNFPAHTPPAIMVEYAHRRPWVEQYHEEAKELLGWDQYQGRLWEGFHRQAVTVMLAYSFLVWLEWQERQQQRRPGRPRGAFSPAARSPALLIGSSPAQHRRLAAGGRHPGVIPHRSHCSLPAPTDLTK